MFASKMTSCHQSNFRNAPCRVTSFFLMSLGSILHVDFKNGHVALSNLGVEGHTTTAFCEPSGELVGE